MFNIFYPQYPKSVKYLLKLVRDHPILYDSSIPGHDDPKITNPIWQKISMEMNVSAGLCKNKWRYVQRCHKKCLRRNLERTNKKPRTYRYAKELEFMKPYYTDVFLENSSNFDDVCGDHTQKGKVAIDSASGKKNDTKISSEKDDLTVSSQKFDNTSEFDPSDPTDAFLLSVRSTLRTFEPIHLNSVKTKLFALVQEQELQHLQQLGQKRRGNPCLARVSSSFYKHFPLSHHRSSSNTCAACASPFGSPIASTPFVLSAQPDFLNNEMKHGIKAM